MLRWANRRCLRARVSVIKETRLWLQSFVSPFASKASSTLVNPSLSKVRSNFNQGDASVSQSKVHRQHGLAGDAKISVRNAARQDVNVQFCNGHVRASLQDAKGHPIDGDARVIASVPCAQIQSLDSCSPSIWDSSSDLVPNDDTILASSSILRDKCLPSDVSNASGEPLSRHASLQTLLIQTQKKAPKASSDLQQKVELLESEQFSLSDAAMLVKTRAFKACSFQQLSTVLQGLKEIFPSAKAVHEIVVGSSNILLEPAELVQKKLKLLYDFQVEEKVVSRLCSRGKVLSLSVESLQQKLMFYKDKGLTVEARNVLFSRGPLILLRSLEKSIQPTLHFLESTGLTRENLGRHCPPAVFYMSLDNNLIKKYEYCTRLGFSAEEFLKACNCVGRTSIKNMEECVQYLKDRGFTDDDVVSMVKKRPSILCHSLQNIKCKLDFLTFEQKRDMAEIVKDPYCLTLSLQRRMVPRFKLIRELGHSKVYSLSYILCCSESMFMKRFWKRKESGFSAAG